jgi:hypothetical protein
VNNEENKEEKKGVMTLLDTNSNSILNEVIEYLTQIKGLSSATKSEAVRELARVCGNNELYNLFVEKKLISTIQTKLEVKK